MASKARGLLQFRMIRFGLVGVCIPLCVAVLGSSLALRVCSPCGVSIYLFGIDTVVRELPAAVFLGFPGLGNRPLVLLIACLVWGIAGF